MSLFMGCKCCGKVECQCVKLNGFSDVDWQFCEDVSPNGQTNPDFVLGPNRTSAQYYSDDGQGTLTVWTEIDDEGEVLLKFRLKGTFTVSNASTAVTPKLEALAYVKHPLDNGQELGWPTQFNYCWSHAGSGENVWNRTRNGSNAPMNPPYSVDINACLVQTKYQSGYDDPSLSMMGDVADQNARIDTWGVVRQKLTFESASVVSPFKKCSLLIDRPNLGMVGEQIWTSENGAMQGFYRRHGALAYQEEDTLANWPLRFGVSVSWTLEKGFKHEIDSTITVKRFRVGFPQRVQRACCANLIEFSYSDVNGVPYGKDIHWEETFVMMANQNFPSFVPPGEVISRFWWPRRNEPPEIIGTPDTHPQEWAGFPYYGGWLDGTHYLSNGTMSSWYSGGDCCRLFNDISPDQQGHYFTASYREHCRSDGTYFGRFVFELYYKVYRGSSRLIQSWFIDNPDFGAWNVGEPSGGFMGYLTPQEQANISMQVAFVRKSPSPGGGSTPILPGFTSNYFVNDSPGFGDYLP